MPDNVDGLSKSNLSKLETKITQILTSNGIGSIGYNNNFAVYPVIEIYETKPIEGGMENLLLINCQLNLFLKNLNNNLIFASIDKPLSGIGRDKQSALSNAISKIKVNDTDLQAFVQNGKTKIIGYYEANCQDLINESEICLKKQEFEKALGLLMAVPAEVSCYKKLQEKSIDVYKAYQNQKCITQLQEAKAQLALNNYSGALNILGQIDPSTSCFKESQSLMTSAANKVAAEEKKQWDEKMKSYNDNITLEKQRIEAAKEIAVAYYRSKPATINYSTIIK